MRRVILCLTLMLCLAAGTVYAATREPAQVPVLVYHHLMEDPPSGNGAIISVREFEQQMAWLSVHGYNAISTAQLADWLEGKGSLPDRPVLITLDDGYESNYEHAYPILARHGLKATIFVVSSSSYRQPGQWAHLSWDQMREMVKSGRIEIGAHSHDGHRQILGRPALTVWTAERIRTDTDQLAQAFRTEGLPVPAAYAYPWGRRTDTLVRELQAAGYRLGFTVEPGQVRRGQDPFALPRLTIQPGTSLCRFAEIVTGERAGETCR